MKLVFLLSTTLLVWAQQRSFPIETEDQQPRQVYDVVVVGAGLTGLSFARKIRELRPNATVVLLEARGQVGGRIRSRSMAKATDDDWVDLGAQFISRDHHALQRVAAELDPPLRLVSQSTCGERTLLLEGSRRKREVSWSPGLSVRPSFREVAESPEAGDLARLTVAAFVESQKLPMADAAATNRLLQTLFDAPEQKASALQVALTAASDNATVTELLLNTGHGQSLLLEKGAYNFARSLADNLHIEYNQKVIGINRQASPAVVMTSSDSFLARQVVVALPPAVASTVIFSPPLKQNFQNFLQQYRPQGNAYYFTATYPTAFWRGKGKSGQIIHTAAKGPLAWLTTFDVTTDTHCVSAAGNTGILWGIAHFSKAPNEKDRYALYSNILKKSLKTDLEPLDVKDMQLSSDPLALGSIGVLPPGVFLDSLSFFTGVVPHGRNTFFASAELSNISTGLMNGAIVAGELAADAVATALSSPLVFRDSSSSPSFAYSTSTHYPPLDDTLHIMLAPALSRQGSQPTSFQYSTSTHYPPSFYDNSIKEEAAVSQNLPQSQFVYRTSSMYPPTERPPETTTYKHFSFGNQNEEEAPANLVASPSTEKQQYGRNFVYRTSTQYPSTESPPAANTFSHFSFGNLGQSEQIPPAYDMAEQPSNAVQIRPQNAVDPAMIAELQQIAQEASTTDSLSLARHLSAVVQQLLQGLRL